MKKLISMLLILCLTLGLIACGGNGSGNADSKDPAGLQVGYARESIMPESVIPLAGVGIIDRDYTGVLDTLYATCIALTDETGNTALLITVDLLNSAVEYTDPAKLQISQATGIPKERIMISASHTHSAPTISATNIAGVSEYKNLVTSTMVAIAKKAISDMAPAQIEAGSTNATGMAYSRHYIMPDGSIEKNFSSSIVPTGHPDEPNDTVQIVRFTRSAEGKKDIIMMTFGVHPTFNGQHSDKNISADFIAPTRQHIEEQTGAQVMYLTSNAGNQTGNSAIPGESLFNRGQYVQYGQALGKIVVDYLPNLKPLASGDVVIQNKVFTADAYKDKVDMYVQAKQCSDYYNKNGEAAVQDMLAEYGFDSIWEAIAIVDRAKMGKTVNVSLNALTVGELSMVFAPFEMFGDTAKYITDNTPYDMTMIVAMANGSHGYFPTEKAYGYQVYEGFVAKVVPGTAEKIADTFVNMLKDMKG